jgi:hypothetical protein
MLIGSISNPAIRTCFLISFCTILFSDVADRLPPVLPTFNVEVKEGQFRVTLIFLFFKPVLV